VVTGTDCQNCGHARRRLATTLPRPAPDGPESTIRRAGTGAPLAIPR
jgi:hypothetical protein